MFWIYSKKKKFCKCKQVLWLFNVVEALSILAWHAECLLASFVVSAAFPAGSTCCMQQWFRADELLSTQSLPWKTEKRHGLSLFFPVSCYFSDVLQGKKGRAGEDGSPGLKGQKVMSAESSLLQSQTMLCILYCKGENVHVYNIVFLGWSGREWSSRSWWSRGELRASRSNLTSIAGNWKKSSLVHVWLCLVWN